MFCMVKNPPEYLSSQLSSMATACAIALLSFFTIDSHANVGEGTVLQPTTLANYRCESGSKIFVSYLPSGNILIYLNNGYLAMRSAVAASGARYTAGNFEWWTKGEFGHLSIKPFGTDFGTAILEACTEYHPDHDPGSER